MPDAIELSPEESAFTLLLEELYPQGDLSMSAERTDFVTDFPTTSLKTALEFVKGNNVSPRDMFLAAENIFSYAGGQFLPASIPIMTQAHAMQAGPAPTADEAEAAIHAVMASHSAGPKATAAPVGKLDWQTILKTLLPFLLGLL